MAAKRFRAIFEPDEGGWLVTLPEVKGCFTWGRSIGAARKNIREALSTCVDVFKDAEKVAAAAAFDEEFRVGREARVLLRELVKTRAKQEALTRDLSMLGTKVARELAQKKGLSLRDTGVLLDLSQEGVRQLLEKKKA